MSVSFSMIFKAVFTHLLKFEKFFLKKKYVFFVKNRLFQKMHIFTCDSHRDLIKMRTDLIPCRLGTKFPIKKLKLIPWELPKTHYPHGIHSNHVSSVQTLARVRKTGQN